MTQNSPDTMHVIAFDTPGGPEVLRPATRPVPVPAGDEVLIRVTAAGLNGPDLVQRRGAYPPPAGASDLLGLEVSGEVIAVGADQDLWQAGDRVCALTNGGGYAEFVVAKAEHCLPVPDGVSDIDAAGLPESFLTVWSNLFLDREIPQGACLLAHGGAGGIGSTAIQLGAAFGLNVLTTVSSDEAAAFARDCGASRAINYTTEDFVEVTRAEGGADYVIDIVGGDYIARNIKACRHDARIIQLAFQSGSKVEINLMPVMLKRLVFTGSTLRSRPDAFKAAAVADLRSRAWPLFAEGRLRAVTHATLPLSQAAEAHRMMESGSHRGKILLSI